MVRERSKEVLAQLCGVADDELRSDADNILSLIGRGIHWSQEFYNKAKALADTVDAEFKLIHSPMHENKC